MSHKMVQYPSTKRVLELPFMDFIGPMQVESLGRKSTCIVLNDQDSKSSKTGKDVVETRLPYSNETS